MKLTTRALALAVALVTAGEAQAQIGIGVSGSGYYSGGGFGFSYQGRRLGFSGFFGGLSYGRQSETTIILGGPVYGPPPGMIVTPILPPPPPYGMPYSGGVIYNPRLPRPVVVRPKSPIEDETAGIDLDLLPKKKPLEEVPAPPKVPQQPPEPEDLPGGKVVSKPAAPKPVQPKVEKKDDPPPQKDKLPEKKMPPAKQPDPPEDLAAALLDQGVAAFRAGEYGLAAHRFRQAAGLNAKLARAQFLLAQAQFALGKFAPAVDAIQAGMDLETQWPKAKFHPRLDLYADAGGELDVHLERLSGAVKQVPNSSTLLCLLAYQHWFDDNRAMAVPLFRRARLTAPDPEYIDRFLKAAGPAVVASN